MRLQLLLIALIVIQFGVNAQEKYIFHLRDTTNNSPIKTFCSRLKVIDARINKDSIGYIRAGRYNNVQPIVPEKSLDKFFSLNSSLTSEYELLFVLHQFSIEDRPTRDNAGTFLFDGDFFIGNNNHYRYLGTIDSMYWLIANQTWNTGLQIVKLAQDKIPSLIATYNCSLYPDTGVIYSEHQAIIKRTLDKQLPIYQTTVFKKGIYYTPEQFINNQPVDTPLYISDKTDASIGGSYVNFFMQKRAIVKHLLMLIHSSRYMTDNDGM